MSVPTVEQARALAKHFIRPCVERGDSYESLKAGGMGCWLTTYRACIGSFGFGDCRAKRGADALVVSRIGEEDCCFEFSLRRLYDEIAGAVPEQVSMFGDGQGVAA